MTQKNISNSRLISQRIVDPICDSAKEIVNCMGALQAQDFNMAKWAIGLRLRNPSEQKIDAAIDSAEIIRTHVLRPTWHFISSDDIYWMLDLTALRLLSSMKGRNKQLELSSNVFKKANKIIEKILIGNKNLPRRELVNEINKAKIKTDNNRVSHILLNAELEGLICSGKMKDNQTTYALLNERVEKPKPIKKEEALYKLATQYFRSHFPATLQDFCWWSGLSFSDAKQALESIKDHFICEKVREQEYWLPNSFTLKKNTKESAFLLPAFDEFLISYKDRSAAILHENQSKAFSNNGIFWPTIVINGQVKGLWKREIKKDTVVIEPDLFDKKNDKDKELIKEAAEKFGCFLNKKTEVIKISKT
jgi:hypothetical protein